MNDEAPNDAASEKARADAEARRLRILEKSATRMGIVSGEVSSKQAAQDEEDAAARASKMQALKRRRFKQASAARAAKEEEEEDAAIQSQDKAVEDTGATTTATSTAVIEKEPTAEEEGNVESTTEGSKKKYKGVARMRRQMIKEKQKEAAIDSTTTTVPDIIAAPLLEKRPVNRIPIFLHLFTTILLFIAGLDVGWNQMAYADVTVHRELAPRQHGPGILDRAAAYPKADLTQLLSDDQTQWSGTTHEDEFSSTDESGGDGSVPSIDPLFGVDLDAMTKGDGIFLTLARGAVVLHRLLLRIFYYMPIRIFKAVIHIPMRLVETPPILCIVSLLLRQGTKLILGAGLPASEEGGKSKDVLDMAKNWIYNFISGSFPTVVSLYDTFNHLRSDMYVILFGVFVGLALTHDNAVFEGVDVPVGDVPADAITGFEDVNVPEEAVLTGDEL